MYITDSFSGRDLQNNVGFLDPLKGLTVPPKMGSCSEESTLFFYCTMTCHTGLPQKTLGASLLWQSETWPVKKDNIITLARNNAKMVNVPC